MSKTALVISGGGSKGAFAVGVLKWLAKHRPEVDFDIIAGTSTGALIAPLAALKEFTLLERVYTSVNTEDVILKGNLGERFLRHTSLYSVQPLISLVKREFTPERYNRLMESGKEVFISTVCLQTRRITYFTTSDMPASQHYDVIRIANYQEMVRAIIASANQPVFMPPVEIRSTEEQPRQYVDGGVMEYAPIQVTIDAGATDILAIVLSPEQSEPKNQKYDRLVDILLRTISSFSEEVGTNDIRIPRLYSEAIGYINSLKRQVAQETHLDMAEVDRVFGMEHSPFAGRREVNIHIVRPERELPTNGLDFDRGIMRQMVEMGFQAAAALEALPIPATAPIA